MLREEVQGALQRQGGAVWIIRMSDLAVEGVVGRIDESGHLRQLVAVGLDLRRMLLSWVPKWKITGALGVSSRNWTLRAP